MIDQRSPEIPATGNAPKPMPAGAGRVPLWLVLLLAAAVALFARYVARTTFRPHDDIEHHLRAWRSLVFPPSPAATGWIYARQYVRWTLHGRSTSEQVLTLRSQHMAALERLGYVTTKTFTLEHQVSGNAAKQNLSAMIWKRMPPPLHDAGTIEIGWRDQWTVTISGPASQLPVWEQVVREFDAASH